MIEPANYWPEGVSTDSVHCRLELAGASSAGFRAIISSIPALSAHDLKRKVDRKETLTVLDVRTESEWNAGHIDGAIHIHGGKLQERFGDVPRDNPVAVVCGSGYRASIAASFL